MLSKQFEGYEEPHTYKDNMAIPEGIQQSNCSHDILHSLMIKEDDKQKIYEQHEKVLGEHCEDFVSQPLFDEYSDEEKEVSTSPCLEIYSDDPIYDTYEFESWEYHKEDDAHPILIANELSPFLRIDDKQNIYEPIFEPLISEFEEFLGKSSYQFVDPIDDYM